MNVALYPTRGALESLKGSSNHSNTTISVMQAQLDQLSADVETIMASIGSNLGAHVKSMYQQSAAAAAAVPDKSLRSAHTTKLDAIATDTTALKRHADTVQALKDVYAKLEALQEEMQVGIASSNEELASLRPQVHNISAAVEVYSSKLAGINTGVANGEVLAALQKTNYLHAAHTVALGELKERGIGFGSDSAPASSSQGTAKAVQGLAVDLAADLTFLKEAIQADLATSNNHISSLSTQVDDILTMFEAHRAADPSSDILPAIRKSNESHASHAKALEGIRSSNVASASLKEESGVNSLEPHLASILAMLNTHTDTLDAIKATRVAASPEIAPGVGMSGIEDLGSSITAIIDILELHTDILTEIKDDVSPEILTILDNINQKNARQNTILTEIRESDVSDEILTALHASNDSLTNHTVVLADLHTVVQASNDSHVSHTDVLEEIKAARSVESVFLGVAPTNFRGLDTKIGSILTTLSEQNTTLSTIKKATVLSNESHAAHTSILIEIKDATAASNEAHISHSIVLGDLKYTAVASAESHDANAAALTEIKDIAAKSHEFYDTHAARLDEIKEAVAATCGSHASHSADLAEIKSLNSARELKEVVGATSGSGAYLSAEFAKLGELHDSHAASLREMKGVVTATAGPQAGHSTDFAELKELHASHATSLGEIKEAVIAPSSAPADHSADFAELKELHMSHAASLDDIKEAIKSNGDSHDSHSADLAEIKETTKAANDLHASHVAALTEIKASQATDAPTPSESTPSDSNALETHINTIITTLESQNKTLSFIKEAASNPDVLATIAESHEIIKSQTPLLDSIKDSQSHEDILASIATLKTIVEASRSDHEAAVRHIHKTAITSHSLLPEAIGAPALGGTAGAGAELLISKSDDSSAEILNEVKAVRAIVETVNETTTSTALQIDINHTIITTSITTLSDELKAEVDASGTQNMSSISALSGDVKAIELGPLAAAVEIHGGTLKELSALVESPDESVRGTRAHVAGLVDGLERGLNQVGKHAAIGGTLPVATAESSREVDCMPIPEIHEDDNPADEAHTPEPETAKEIEPLAQSELVLAAEHDGIPTLHEPELESTTAKEVPEAAETEQAPSNIVHHVEAIDETPAPVQEHHLGPSEPPIEDVSHLQMDEDEPVRDEPADLELQEHAQEEPATPEHEIAQSEAVQHAEKELSKEPRHDVPEHADESYQEPTSDEPETYHEDPTQREETESLTHDKHDTTPETAQGIPPHDDTREYHQLAPLDEVDTPPAVYALPTQPEHEKKELSIEHDHATHEEKHEEAPFEEPLPSPVSVVERSLESPEHTIEKQDHSQLEKVAEELAPLEEPHLSPVSLSVRSLDTPQHAVEDQKLISNTKT